MTAGLGVGEHTLGQGKTYSLTLCCKGCRKGPPLEGAGVLFSETELAWKWYLEGVGLKRLGEDCGVLFVVDLSGIEADCDMAAAAGWAETTWWRS